MGRSGVRTSVQCWLLITVIAVWGSCKKQGPAVMPAFESSTATISGVRDSLPSGPGVRFVIAPLFSATTSHSMFSRLVARIGEDAGINASVVYCKRFGDVLELFRTRRVEIGLVGVGLHTAGRSEGLTRQVAVPVFPGQAAVRSYLIVPFSSPVRGMPELGGARMALSDSLSATGYAFAVQRARECAVVWRGEIISGTHENSINLVNRGVVDASCVCSYVYEVLERNNPALVANIRVIEQSPPMGTLSVVASVDLADSLYMRVQKAICGLAADPAGAALLAAAGFEGFIPTDEESHEKARHPAP